MLSIRYEPQVGIRRMKELVELHQLQNKRCKNAAETSMLVVEIDRRKRLIEEIGGSAPSNDTMVGVLWMSADPSTRTHVASNVDAEEALYHDLRVVVMKFTTLVGATTVAKVTPMDIGAIEEAGSPGVVTPHDAAWPEEETETGHKNKKPNGSRRRGSKADYIFCHLWPSVPVSPQECPRSSRRHGSITTKDSPAATYEPVAIYIYIYSFVYISLKCFNCRACFARPLSRVT